MVTSISIPSSVSISAAARMTGKSESEPIMMETMKIFFGAAAS
jgi:hypothetical protein